MQIRLRDVVDRDQGATVPHLRRGEVENHAIVALHPRVELLEEGKLLKELEEDVQVSQLVVANQKHLQEFEALDSLDV